MAEKTQTVTAPETVTEGAAAPIVLVLLATDQIKSDQDAIKVNLTDLDKRIHANAVQCLLHAEKHGDTSLMRRLLVDIIDKDNGYRRAGLIQWMRFYSPMELSKDTINLSGTYPNGDKRPFQVDKANADPFWKNRKFDEVVKPVFRDTFTSPIDKAIKDFRAAIANTQADGSPIDPKKPTYVGLHADKVVDFCNAVEAMKAKLPLDDEREVYMARETIRKAEAKRKADEEANKAASEVAA